MVNILYAMCKVKVSIYNYLHIYVLFPGGQ